MVFSMVLRRWISAAAGNKGHGVAMGYKLTYFQAKARAETSRMLLCLAGQEFEDKRIDEEQWVKILQGDTSFLNPAILPFGQLPILEYDGKLICQSKTIERFIAKKYGLCGRNTDEETQCDMIVECVNDVISPLSVIWSVEDDHTKKVLEDTYVKKLPQNLKYLEQMMNDSGLFVGNSISWPDIAFYNSFNWPNGMGIDVTNIVSEFPKIQTAKRVVESNEQLKRWIASRPDTII